MYRAVILSAVAAANAALLPEPRVLDVTIRPQLVNWAYAKSAKARFTGREKPWQFSAAEQGVPRRVPTHGLPDWALAYIGDAQGIDVNFVDEALSAKQADPRPADESAKARQFSVACGAGARLEQEMFGPRSDLAVRARDLVTDWDETMWAAMNAAQTPLNSQALAAESGW